VDVIGDEFHEKMPESRWVHPRPILHEIQYCTFSITGTSGRAQFGRSRFLCKAQEIISALSDCRMACCLTAENKIRFPASPFHKVARARLVRRRPLTASGVALGSDFSLDTTHPTCHNIFPRASGSREHLQT
jgi:hypothetical protein